jgi:hypothetical protein
MPAGLQRALELHKIVNPGVYRPVQSLFHRCERIRNLGKLELPEDKDIDVAGLLQPAFGQGTVDSGVTDPVDQGRQSGAKQIRRAHGLLEQGAEGIENRRPAIGLVEDLPATTVGLYQSDAFQTSKLSLRRSCACASEACELPEVEGLILAGEKQRQKLAASPPEKQFGRRVGGEGCTHGEY